MAVKANTMTRKQRYALFVGLLLTLVYWGFYNWVTYGVTVDVFGKGFAAFCFLFFAVPATAATYDNTSND